MYFRKIADQFIESTLPDTFVTNAGETIIGFRHLPSDELIQHGYYPGRNMTPDYDARLYTCAGMTFEETASGVDYCLVLEAIPVATLRATKIAKAYAICADILDSQARGYSVAEVATWPAMRAEITAYNQSGTIGPSMSAVIALGRHTAITLAAALSPKVAAYNTAIAAREAHISSLLSLEMALAVADYDVLVGWD